MADGTTVGVIGLGGLGRLQARVLAEREDVTVVGGADVAEDARAAFVEAVGAPSYADHADLLAEHDPDAAAIVTPHTLHHGQAVDCIEAGTDVHLEKPMVTTTDDAVDLLARAAAADRIVQVGYQRHFSPRYRELRRIVETGRIGPVHTAACHLAQDWISGQEGTWRTDPALSGGGQLIDSGSHLLDALLWSTDATPATVAAVTDDWGHDVDVNSAVAATLAGPDHPITASVGVSGDGHRFEEGLFLWGTEGHAALADGELRVAENDGAAEYTAAPGDKGYREGLETKLGAFVEAVRGEREVAVPGAYGLRVTALTEAAFDAAAAGETVDARTLVADALGRARETVGDDAVDALDLAFDVETAA
jgi:predicted dehydrogenase